MLVPSSGESHLHDELSPVNEVHRERGISLITGPLYSRATIGVCLLRLFCGIAPPDKLCRTGPERMRV